jgi:hypothetical protein
MCDNLLVMLAGKRLLSLVTGKTDTAKLRAYFKQKNVFPELWMTGSQKPKAPYVMDEIGGRHALEWLRDLKVPSTFGLRPASMFSTLDAGECHICLSCWHTFVDQRWH